MTLKVPYISVQQSRDMVFVEDIREPDSNVSITLLSIILNLFKTDYIKWGFQNKLKPVGYQDFICCSKRKTAN